MYLLRKSAFSLTVFAAALIAGCSGSGQTIPGIPSAPSHSDLNPILPLSATPSGYGNLVLADGAIVYYPFTANASDYGPNHLNGTAGSAITFSAAGASSVTGNANSVIKVTNNSILKPTDVVSFEEWIVPGAAPKGDVQVISAGNDTKCAPYELGFNSTGANIQMSMSTAATCRVVMG